MKVERKQRKDEGRLLKSGDEVGDGGGRKLRGEKKSEFREKVEETLREKYENGMFPERGFRGTLDRYKRHIGKKGQ